jgi:gliding motility-associated-like protein
MKFMSFFCFNPLLKRSVIMKKTITNALTILLVTLHFVAFSQYKRTEKIDRQSYQTRKDAGTLERGVRYVFDAAPAGGMPVLNYSNARGPSTHHDEIMSGNCGLLPPVTFTTVVFDDWSGTGDSLVDDASSPEILLPFTFCFYGTNYNSCYINSNGNITFGASETSFSSTGFPNTVDTMIAPFWADFDNRGGNGLVQYSIGSMGGGSYLVVRWDHMGYFSMQNDKLNTCSLIITDGISTILPAGNNVGFFYGDMNWTTGSASSGVNGYGGIAATVGMNKGDGTNYIQVGRFDTSGTQFISNVALNNGVDWLDNKTFFFNLCSSTNIAPVSTNYTDCDTIIMCSYSDTLLLQNYFASPEVDQITTVTISAPTLGANFTTITNTPGSTATVVNQLIGSAALSGYHTVTYTATDNGTPTQTTVINLTIYITNPGTADPIVTANPTGICPGDTTTLTLVNCSSYVNHVWNNGSAGCSTMISAQGTQYVTVEDANGCLQTKFIDVYLIPQPLPVVTGNLNYCGGDPGTNLSLAPATSAEPNYANIVWDPAGVTGSNFTATAGTYTVTVTGDNGCVNDAVFSVENLGPPAFTATNDTCMSIAAPVQLNVNFSCVSSVSCALTAACPGGSPQNYTVGTGSASPNADWEYPTPYGNWFGNARHQFLVLASELTALGVQPGNINSIAWNVTNTNGIDPLPNFTIKMMCTNLTTLPATTWSDNFIPGTIQVYSTPSLNVVTGMNVHNFTQPYAWDGTSNLIVETCFDMLPFTANASVVQSTTTFTSSINAYSDVDPVCTSPITGFPSYGDYMQRPDMTFNVVSSVDPANYSYSWAPATGLSCTNCINPIATPAQGASITYTVTVGSLINPSCTLQDSVTITTAGFVSVFPVDNDSIFCSTDAVEGFTASMPNGTWSHHATGGGNGGGIIPVANALANFHPELSVLGTSYVVYTVGPANCAIQDSVEVQVFQKIPANFTTIGPFCEYETPVTLNSIAANLGGNWTIDGNPATTFDPAVLGPSTPPGYKLKYKTDLGVGCPDSVQKLVEVYAAPHVSFTADTLAGCLPNVPIQFNGSVGYSTNPASSGTFTWNFGDAATSAMSFPVFHVYNTAGAMTVSLNYTDNRGCMVDTMATSYINIYALPAPDFMYDPANPTALEPHVNFFNTTPNATGLTWNWNIAGLDSSMAQDTVYDFPNYGLYDITLTATSPEGCEASVMHEVNIRPDYVIYVPSSFTPNGDGKNDLFIPKSDGVQATDYTMSIYDRWGEKIFSTNDVTEGWKGSRANSDNVVNETGIYIYKIIYKDAFLKGHTITGQVTVVK